MAHPQIRRTFFYVVSSLVFFATIFHHSLRLSPTLPPPLTPTTITTNHLINEQNISLLSKNKPLPFPFPTTSVLIPNWEVLVLLSSSEQRRPNDFDNYVCLFDTREISPANFSGVLPFPNRYIYSCFLPTRARRRLPFNQPVLIKLGQEEEIKNSTWLPLLRWNYMAYDSLTTENDVVLFVKGVNTRQGINRKPGEFNCVFGDGDGDDVVRSRVTSSIQEVFRCERPNDDDFTDVKVSLEVINEKRVVPSLAYYNSVPSFLGTGKGKALICATTMVYNVAKYLKEWVLYHSQIGVEKFLLYDNESDDDLAKVVDDLVKQGFDITTYFWLWPKTQEGGFSHGAIYARDACTWMMYIDVDEFIYSPLWDDNVTQPSKSLLQSLVSNNGSKYGQFSIGCHEFGPSGQRVHPVTGVTQGYNCRRKYENRHKSIVLLDAVDESLLNVIHHFTLKPGYKTKRLHAQNMVVNHYKYQAWPEFRSKFRRRVSAYVLDWTQKSNPTSNDRTPGLGYSPVEPPGWPDKFCEIHDNRLRDLGLKWFGTKSDSGYELAWQR